ncbi:hypothetical protein SISSUDRAFT_1060165 [Sistotremastrum suecicum HHB10207 ss-3]|uniref:RNA polymerase II elongation factor ELL N-terminal domain-containing protein n=1 Tax=Sistotremastrum suecicum HHB10207 ss-3 TaxID=1314776 RepID=A0A166FD55_9AGAM|nr:hypothetical protein SISSUDRAFT_1060165 [Sistotremastrum suecicum HHB10207 ss-3]
MPLPNDGTLSVQGHALNAAALGTKTKKAMIIKLSEETLDALMTRRADKPTDIALEIDFGSKPGLHIGGIFFGGDVIKENSPHDIYIRSDKALAPLRNYANVQGKLTIKRELGAKSANKVRNSTIKSEQSSKERQIQRLDVVPPTTTTNGAPKKASTKKKSVPGSSSGSNSLMKQLYRNEGQHLKRASHVSVSEPSTSRRPSPMPPSTGMSAASTAELQAHPQTREKLIHFLALKSRSTEEVIASICDKHGNPPTASTVQDLLRSIAVEDQPADKSNPNGSGKHWRLRSESWTEVRPYEYPKLTDEERNAMARSARRVFHATLKITEKDPRWQHIAYPKSNGHDGQKADESPPKKHKPPSRTDALSVPVSRNLPPSRTPSDSGGSKPNSTAPTSEKVSAAHRRSLPGSKNVLQRVKAGSPLPSSSSTPTPHASSKPPSSSTLHDRPSENGHSPLLSKQALSKPLVPPEPKRKRASDEERSATPIDPKRRRVSEEDDRKPSLPNGDSEKKRRDNMVPGSAERRSHQRSQSDVTFSAKRIQKELSPIPGPRVPMPSFTKGHRPSSSRDERESSITSTKMNGSSKGEKRRRNSPHYTSTEDEDEGSPSKSQKSSSRHQLPLKPSSSSSTHTLKSSSRAPRTATYIRPTLSIGGPLPTDHHLLRRKYQSIYPTYLHLFQLRLAQRSLIEQVLGPDGSTAAEEGEVDEELDLSSDALAEMMDPKELEVLNTDCEIYEKELRRIEEALRQ